jgi:hypothetical protein
MIVATVLPTNALRPQEVTDVGHKFSLVLNREITDDESAALREAGCAEAVFCTDSHPTNPDLPVTKMDFDDENSPSLAEAIESALEAVKNVQVPDLKVPGLTVPAQPVEAASETDAAGASEADAAERSEAAVGEEASAAAPS